MSKDTVIDNIQKIRAKNNKNCMDLLRLAFKFAPKEAKVIMAKITACDAEINNLTKQL